MLAIESETRSAVEAADREAAAAWQRAEAAEARLVAGEVERDAAVVALRLKCEEAATLEAQRMTGMDEVSLRREAVMGEAFQAKLEAFEKEAKVICTLRILTASLLSPPCL